MMDLDKKQLEEVIDIIKNLYNHDFSGYTKASLRRRVIRLMERWKCQSFVEFKLELTSGTHDYFEILNEITVNTTEMFRDPLFYSEIQDKVIPRLKSYPQIKVWHAGCSTGEEVYSFAIMFYEMKMLSKTTQYGTDLNTKALAIAKEGIYDVKEMKAYSRQYQQAGGIKSLSNYYTAKYDKVFMKKFLKNNFVFSQHDMIGGAVFNQFEMIVCRNVFIYFDQEAQNKIIEFFLSCLKPFGFLILGSQETIAFSMHANKFETISREARIYKKKGQ